MTKMLDEGVIKFKYNLKLGAPIEKDSYIELEKWRVILFKMGLIGEYPIEKVGYGNLSKKLNTANQFVITGTQTGRFAHLTGMHYTKVTKCDLKKMSVEAMGPIAPSSESLTHFAIYSTCNQINTIFHIHNESLWNYMIENDLDATGENVSYGTQEMADAVKDCIGSKTSGVLVMKGHQDGIISYGTSAEEAGKIILETIKQSKK